MEKNECTIFGSGEGYDGEGWIPCRCPRCNGFLPQDFPIGRQFQCRKCGAVLETLPEYDPELDDDEQDEEMEFGGMICKVPDYAVKIEIRKYPRTPRIRKHRTDRWALGIGFSRLVWKDKNGEFILISGERISVEDPRILKFTDRESRMITLQGEMKNE